jgi:radical SAM protein with 4Fe4S-binding SPASM domain
VNEAYTKYGFRGFIAWHYYNEPMLQATRIFNLMDQIRKEFPGSRFLLWTNCTILPKDSRVKLFERVHCTDYLNVGADKLYEYFKVSWFGYKGKDTVLDDRLVISPGEKSFERCLRLFTDFIIDNYGEVPLCCHDWQNTVKVGNIWKNSLEEILEVREILIKKICGKEMLKDAPERCLRCQYREYDPMTGEFIFVFDRNIANESLKYLEDSQNT